MTINEKEHFQTIMTALRNENPESTEEEIQKMADLEFDVMFCYLTLSFEDNEYKYRDQKWVKRQLIECSKIDKTTTDVDILRALNGNVKRKRLYSTYFTDSGITKYKYDAKYIQPVKKFNPFEMDDYKKIMSEVKA